ncbi:hypothetical protein OSB04_014538 [Centaurea solstitialis]|uniref:Uncharacterized protein n=1 Tax=Centaurea solstitialis TaxID=347529 RepID=A0AA38TH49_9ASTR|nr:hypothetical protein OSB04_014538 [Centaurea solstitialis]
MSNLATAEHRRREVTTAYFLRSRMATPPSHSPTLLLRIPTFEITFHRNRYSHPQTLVIDNSPALLPFASNLIMFPAPNPSGVARKPEFRHVEGDSIALTFAECNLDFIDLIGNHPRDCNKFYPLVPLLEAASKVSDFVKIPIFSVQVTIFRTRASRLDSPITTLFVMQAPRTPKVNVYDLDFGWGKPEKKISYSFSHKQPEEMAAIDDFLTILEKCQISPPLNTIGERSLPLTFFDLGWLLFHPIHQLFFYEFPHSKSRFIETVIPNLKHSLSITLQHFFPFASNLIVYPAQNPRKPEIRHVEGDFVALTFAECSLDFNDLIGNHPRECSKFYPLVPVLEGGTKVSDFVKFPIFSVQVTVFPNSGFTIGLTNHHTLSDATSRYELLKAWTSIAKYGTDEIFLANGSLPFYDRVIEYPQCLDDIFFNQHTINTLDENYRHPQLVSSTDRVRATFVLTRAQINSLKKWILLQLPKLEYVSSFTLGCAYIWTCITKSRVHLDRKKTENELERFACVIDWRSRLDPPVPQTYFGNCVGPCFTTMKSTILTGNKGFVTAVELITKSIRETVKNNQGMLKDAETWLDRFVVKVPTVGVAGTPKHDVYGLDFGWGKPKKYETISIDFGQAISVNVSSKSPEDLEFGLSLPAKQMDAFISIYGDELEGIISEETS